jgi:hypothetical protein
MQLLLARPAQGKTGAEVIELYAEALVDTRPLPELLVRYWPKQPRTQRTSWKIDSLMH